MANGEDETGSKDRATVALVHAEVGKVDVKVDGALLLLGYIREDIRALGAIAGQVMKLEATVDSLGRRMDTQEKRLDEAAADREEGEKESRAYRRGQLPAIIFAAIGALGVIITIATQLH